MERSEFWDMMEADFKEILTLNKTKGKDYAAEDDPFSNFKKAAEDLGLTAEQIWGVYAGKHWSSIMTYCREGKVESEGIESRLLDLILYCFLLLGMVRDDPDV